MKNNNKIFFIILAAGIIVALGEAVYLYARRDRIFKNERAAAEINTTTPLLFVNKLDGILTDRPEDSAPGPVAIMIDNHPNARPQSGLSQARVTYEAPVEGGITRFFAIYVSADAVAKVGPVRSARPYFLDWLSEYGDIPFWHAGGSKEALDKIKQYKIWDVNEFYFGPYFWRAAGREAPHNLYTSSEKWQSFLKGTPRESSDWQGWSFSPVLSDSYTITDVTELQIKYEKSYSVRWVYDAATERYIRHQNGDPVLDESGSQVYADTVVVQEVEVEVVDEEGRKEITTVGKGDARVLVHGKSVRGYWKKEGRTERTRFYDLGNREITLHPGKIFIQIIPQNTPMEVSS